MDAHGLTPKQKELLDFIRAYMRDTGGVAPTFDEMRVALGLHAKSGISRILAGLEKRGHIARLPYLSRSIMIICD